MKKISLFLVYFFSFIFMEILYKILVGNEVFRLSIINMILFIILFSLIIYVITRFFKEKTNKIIYIIFLSIIALWFSAEYVVKSYFDFYISLSSFQVADQLGDFIGKAIIETIKRIFGIILFFVPLIISLFFKKHINFEQMNKKNYLLIMLVILSFYSLYIISLNINKKEIYSPYQLYYKVNDVSLNIESFGVINTFVIDVKRLIFGFEEEIVINENLNYKEEVPNEEIIYDKNMIDIDFESLINIEKDETIKQIHQYMNSDSGTFQNEFTGMFKDKNLILFMAESFNDIAVDKNLTPTLYKLVNSGFIFKNFYSPTIYSTIGGEFQELTGLYPESASILSKFKSGKIYFPQGIGNKFKEINYNTYAYHNNSYFFQNRNKYLKSIGFDNFKACYNGLEELINCKEWPQSDVSMLEATIDDYINDDNFMVFYATVSGHSYYTWTNAQAKKHKEEYLGFNLGYSEGPASYAAANMELDKALELLIQKLDEKGILSDTVIALVGDHYPYELTIEEINEISNYEKDKKVEVNRSNFILWNSEMDNIEIYKVGSQIDVIPTIYNLFGINYDSRMFIGKDILSTEGGLAIFDNRSWVTDKGTYFSHDKKFVPKDGIEVDYEYVKTINQIVNNKIIMSKMIIENNYYKKVFK